MFVLKDGFYFVFHLKIKSEGFFMSANFIRDLFMSLFCIYNFIIYYEIKTIKYAVTRTRKLSNPLNIEKL